MDNDKTYIIVFSSLRRTV